MVERCGHLFRFLAGGAVYDSRFVRMFGDVLRHPRGLVLVLGFDDVEIQVRPVESRDRHLRIMESQHGDDVSTHALRGRRGEGDHCRTGWQARDEFPDSQIGRSEILPPLRHAVRLVHGHQRNRRVACEVTESFCFQAFRGDVKQFDLPGCGLCEHRGLLVRRLRGVDERGRNADVVQRVHLVAHQ